MSVGVVAIDPDIPADSLTYDVALEDGGDVPNWLSFDATSQLLSGTPTATDEGTIRLRVSVADDGGLSDEKFVSITVTNATIPTLVSPISDQVITEGEPFSLDVTSSFDDADGDDLVFMIAPAGSTTELPSWLTFTDGVFGGTPPLGAIGAFELSVAATDPDSNEVSDTFVITVSEDVNVVPQVAAEQVFRVAPDATSGTDVGGIVATDGDGDALSYTIVDGNAGDKFAIDANTGAITVDTAGALQGGVTESLTIEISDGVAAAETTATIYVTAQSVSVKYSLQAFDTDGNAITTVTPGQEIELRMFVQDVRENARGVFSAYADVVYGVAVVSPVDGSIVHSATYGAGPGGNLNIAGMVDELGGTDGITDLGGDALEVARVRFTVSSEANGMVHFAVNIAEDAIQHPTSVFGVGSAVPGEQIEFGSLILDVQDTVG